MKKSLYNIFIASLTFASTLTAQAGKFGEQLPANQGANSLQNRMKKVQERLSTPSQSKHQTPALTSQNGKKGPSVPFTLDTVQQPKNGQAEGTDLIQKRAQEDSSKTLEQAAEKITTAIPQSQTQKPPIFTKMKAGSSPNELDDLQLAHLIQKDATTFDSAIDFFGETLETGFDPADADGQRVSDKLNSIIQSLDGVTENGQVYTGINAVKTAIGVPTAPNLLAGVSEVKNLITESEGDIAGAIDEIGALITSEPILPLPGQNISSHLDGVITSLASPSSNPSVQAAITTVAQKSKGSALVAGENLQSEIQKLIGKIDSLTPNNINLPDLPSTTLGAALKRMADDRIDANENTFDDQVRAVGKWIDGNEYTGDSDLLNRAQDYRKFITTEVTLTGDIGTLETFMTNVSVSNNRPTIQVFDYLIKQTDGPGTSATTLAEAINNMCAMVDDISTGVFSLKIAAEMKKISGTSAATTLKAELLTAAGAGLNTVIAGVDPTTLRSTLDMLAWAKKQFSFQDGTLSEIHDRLSDLATTDSGLITPSTFYQKLVALQPFILAANPFSTGITNTVNDLGSVTNYNTVIGKINANFLNEGEAKWPEMLAGSASLYDQADMLVRIGKRLLEKGFLKVARSAAPTDFKPLPTADINSINSLEDFSLKILNYAQRTS
jgi:hypothetical protein